MNTVVEFDESSAFTAARVSWAAIFAGTILSIGLWILLHLGGVAAGLTAIDPDSPSSLRAAGIGTGIWSVIASLIALFLGGLATARIAGPVDRLGGALHGAVLWALTTIAAVTLFVTTAGVLLRSVARAGAVVVGTQADALQAAENTGKGLWWVFFALLLGLFSAVLGASVAVSRTQRRTVEQSRQLPLGPTAQVHP